ncbi:hypothetical protein ACTJJ7_00715 [Phyllobacterium sp. 22229]|uniref:hypothetical protein n=1 Tax=Phyllobacterium sp. 22229 TaxID=3453895 RepID=UPI003F8649BD
MDPWTSLLMLAACIIFIVAGTRIYYKFISMAWDEVEGIIDSTCTSILVDTRAVHFSVKFSYDNQTYCEEIKQTGMNGFLCKSVVGNKVRILVNPKNPKECVVKSNETDPIDASAAIVARTISNVLSFIRHR